MLILYISIK